MIDQSWARLPDGRALCYAEYGDPRGTPAFFFHGWPGSRLLGRLGHRAARSRGVRIIAPDRPGIGRSDPHPGRRLLDWPADVLAMADGLGLDRFDVVGYSNGGPYALACAARPAARLAGVAVVSGMGPTDSAGAKLSLPREVRAFFAVNRRAPFLSRLGVRVMSIGARQLQTFMATQMWAVAPPPDREVLRRKDVFKALKAEYAESFWPGPVGLDHEISLIRRPWGFDLSEVSRRILLYHGEADANVPVALARRVAAELPDCRARFLPGKAHLWFVDSFGEVLDDLADQRSETENRGNKK
ncbi:MAG: alpha/beta hydrolase [bacterium]